jgi:hypothetical protein
MRELTAEQEENFRKLQNQELKLFSKSGRYKYRLLVSGEHVPGVELEYCKNGLITRVDFYPDEDILRLRNNSIISLINWNTPRILEDFSESNIDSLSNRSNILGLKPDLTELKEFEISLREILGWKYRHSRY